MPELRTPVGLAFCVGVTLTSSKILLMSGSERTQRCLAHLSCSYRTFLEYLNGGAISRLNLANSQD